MHFITTDHSSSLISSLHISFFLLLPSSSPSCAYSFSYPRKIALYCLYYRIEVKTGGKYVFYAFKKVR